MTLPQSATHKSTHLALAAAMALGTASTAMADWFDLNGTTAGYGVADTDTYDWLAANAWATTFGGTTAGANWADSTSGTPRDAYLIGAGPGTTYTVRLGSGTSNVTLRNFAINTNASGSIGSGNVTIGNVSDTGVLTLSASNSFGALGGGTLTVNNPIALNGASTNFRGGNVVLNGVVSGTTGNFVVETGLGTFGLTSGTLTLKGTNSYTVNTDVRNGTLDIGGGGATGSISSSSVLVLSGLGTVNLTRSDNFTQTFGNTTLNAGAPVLLAASGNTIDLATLTRNTGGTLSLNTTGTIKTKTANTATSILGGWATVAGTNWAVSAGDGTTSGAITALGSYTNDTWAAGNNTTVTTSSAPSSGSTTNSLRFNAAGANTITLAGTNTITTGGILVTSAVGNNLSKITGGTLIGASGKDLVVHQNNTSNDLTIESIIANNSTASGFTKTGAGKVTLTADNTYTGGTYVNGGTLTLSGTSLSGGAVSVLKDAVLELKKSTATAFSTTAATTISGGGTIRINGPTGWGGGANPAIVTIAMISGALIDVQANNFNGGTNSNKVYTNNLADLNVASGATFGTSNVNVRFDALTGSGTIDNSSSNSGGSFTLGVDNGSGTFNGVLAASAANKFAYFKNGAGTQELALSNTTASSIGGFSVQGGTVNHTSGSLTMSSSNLMLILSGAVYTLNGGTLRSGVGDANRGVMIGSNGGGGAGTALAPNTFNLQNGTLDLKTGGATQLMVGRAQNSSATGTFNLYNQTGGTATVGTVAIGGFGATNSVTSIFNATGGSFAADNFTYLANGTSDNVTVLLGTSAQVTLPAFPLARGSSSTANLTLDFTTGYLSPLAASTTYLQAGTFNNAYLSANGAKFNIDTGKDITIGQVFTNKTGEQGTLTKTGTGNLTLTGANAYTGTTSIKNGKLILGGGSNRLSTSGSVVLGDTGTSGVLVLGDGTARSQTLAGLTATGAGGAVVGGAAADSMLSLDIATGANTFSGVLGGGGSNENNLALEKTGNGTLELTAPNTYTGATTVAAGTLSVANPNFADTSTLTIGLVAASPAVLHLPNAGTDVVASLVIDGVTQPNGLYNSANSGGAITGAGAIQVGPVFSSAYETWATGAPNNLTGPDAAFDADPDGDGLDNGLEWILGGDPTSGASHPAPLASTAPSGNLVLTFTREELSIGEATLKVLVGTDLSVWPKEATVGPTGSGPDANGITIAINTTATPDAVTITIPASNAVDGRIFAKLKAEK